MEFLKDYMNTCQLMNVHKLFSMLATEVVDTPEVADVVVTDEAVSAKENAEIIRSYDTERIMALMNS